MKYRHTLAPLLTRLWTWLGLSGALLSHTLLSSRLIPNTPLTLSSPLRPADVDKNEDGLMAARQSLSELSGDLENWNKCLVNIVHC